MNAIPRRCLFTIRWGKPFRAQAVACPAMINILEERARLRLMLRICQK